jgi:hypothetical protein
MPQQTAISIAAIMTLSLLCAADETKGLLYRIANGLNAAAGA